MDPVVDQIRSLAPFGANSLFRRVLATLLPSMRCDDGGGGGGDRGGPWTEVALLARPPAKQGSNKLSFNQMLREYHSDDRRRSVFVDPRENFIAHLVDFYAGRLDVVEFSRPPGLAQLQDLADLIVEAKTRAKNHVPMIAINHVVSDSPQHVVAELRRLASLIERGVSETHRHGRPSEVVALAEECRRIQTSVRDEFSADGKKLYTVTYGIFECRSSDACCWNDTWAKQVEETRVLKWQDGNPSQTPPTVPPEFTNVPWVDQLPIMGAAEYRVQTSDWGWRRRPGTQTPDFHPALDIAAPVGTSVLSRTAGTIVWISPPGANITNRGIVVQGVGNQFHRYLHIDPSNLSVGDPVGPGARLGTVGDYPSPGGRAHHLHYEQHSIPSGQWQDHSDNTSTNPLP
jgi:murein DD-endopeptidase MepM/ murein hydrolase activator NlpD